MNAAFQACAMSGCVPESDIKEMISDSENDKCQSTNKLSRIYVEVI